MPDEIRTTQLCGADCVRPTTHGTNDPAVRICDMCGGIVPTDPATGNYLDAMPQTTADVLVELCERPPCSDKQIEALLDAAADDIAKCRSMLRRAMEHGLDGSAHYHAMRAGDLGDEIRAYLQEHPI